jgi:hypothetical protein
MKIQFGIMSSRYEMECQDLESAKVAMCLFFKQNIPIAIYSPEETAFRPSDFLIKEGLGTKEEINKGNATDIFVERLLAGNIRSSQTLEGYAIAQGLTIDIFRSRVVKKLRRMGKSDSLSNYYWDKKAKKDRNRNTNYIYYG